MIINVAIHETRIAIIEDGRLVEILVERPENERMVGDIYKGIVKAVLPGMQASFVDIGTEKSAFLHVSDVAESYEEYDFDNGDNNKKDDSRSKRQKFVPIQEMLQTGQEILVQITKEPIGTKGPRITSEISLPGRFTVLVPGGDHIGISRKIVNWSEKRKLKEIIGRLQPEGCGLIIRTVGKGKGEGEFKSDIRTLFKIWTKIEKRAHRTKAPAIIHKEMGMTSSIIRDLFTDDVDRVVTDSKREYKQILSYLKSVAPHLRSRVELYADRKPIFDAFQIEDEIEKASNRKVWLKGGGFIVIDHTEALVTVDVNSGRYVGRTNQVETIMKTNLEAAMEIARQLRLRDIGGIIVIDFIDVASFKDRKRVQDEISAALRKDRSKTDVSTMSEFGIVQMTRQRVRPSLLHTFSEPCPLCNGLGRVQGRDTTVTKIERWLKRSRVTMKECKLQLRVHPTVGEYLTENKKGRLKLLEKVAKVRLELQEDPELPIEEYRVFSLRQGNDITHEFKA